MNKFVRMQLFCYWIWLYYRNNSKDLKNGIHGSPQNIKKFQEKIPRKIPKKFQEKIPRKIPRKFREKFWKKFRENSKKILSILCD